jgi:hypothetical protein
MAQLFCRICCPGPGLVALHAEGDQLDLIEEWLEEKSRQAAVLSAGE